MTTYDEVFNMIEVKFDENLLEEGLKLPFNGKDKVYPLARIKGGEVLNVLKTIFIDEDNKEAVTTILFETSKKVQKSMIAGKPNSKFKKATENALEKCADAFAADLENIFYPKNFMIKANKVKTIPYEYTSSLNPY